MRVLTALLARRLRQPTSGYVLLAVVAGSWNGCSCHSSSTTSLDGGLATHASSTPTASRPATAPAPPDAGPADLLARRVCALERRPERRKTECCATSSGVGAGVMEGQCVRTLGNALRAETVSVSSADVDRCAAAMERATAGCDWVTPTGTLPPVAECDGIIHGTLAAQAQCRSSLECVDGLECQKLSVADPGKCAPPKQAGQPCELAADMLAAFTRQNQASATHPECAGYCQARQCREAVRVGGPCKLDAECGRGRCEDAKCVDRPLPGPGQPCTSACAAGARCSAGKCIASKLEGAACTVDAECRGACVGADASTAGMCMKTCTARPAPSPSPSPSPSRSTH
jgi:hypothetical protein